MGIIIQARSLNAGINTF